MFVFFSHKDNIDLVLFQKQISSRETIMKSKYCCFVTISGWLSLRIVTCKLIPFQKISLEFSAINGNCFNGKMILALYTMTNAFQYPFSLQK